MRNRLCCQGIFSFSRLDIASMCKCVYLCVLSVCVYVYCGMVYYYWTDSFINRIAPMFSRILIAGVYNFFVSTIPGEPGKKIAVERKRCLWCRMMNDKLNLLNALTCVKFHSEERKQENTGASLFQHLQSVEIN